jgi:hypothetical protein
MEPVMKWVFWLVENGFAVFSALAGLLILFYFLVPAWVDRLAPIVASAALIWLALVGLLAGLAFLAVQFRPRRY